MSDSRNYISDAEVLRSIEGSQLGSVQFFLDCVRLHFDGPNLTTYSMPTVNVSGKCY